MYNINTKNQFNADKHLVRLVVSAILTALSIIIMFVTRNIKFPPMPWLVYDLADMPLLIGAIMYGPWNGLLSLFVMSFLQAFPLGGDGIAGFIMHFVSSSALIVIVGLFAKKPSWKRLISGMLLGVVAVTLIMIPLNLTVTVHLFHTPRQAVIDGMPLILLFNITKNLIVCSLTLITFKALLPFFKSNAARLGLSNIIF